MDRPKLIAYYLPQYHPIPENDRWWGKGFTEWTNVTKAKPFFSSHYQPRLPLDLGFYDLRIPEVREQQARLAKLYGVYGFCYYHYWFGNGKKLLERPAQEVLDTGKPDFPFMFCWANHKWSSHWIGNDSPDILMEQEYLGTQDYVNHFMYLLPFFKDRRYIRIEGKVAFQIYKPTDVPDLDHFLSVFRQLAREKGLGEIYFIGGNCSDNDASRLTGLDGFTSNELGSLRKRAAKRIFNNKNSLVGKIESRIRNLKRKGFYDLERPIVIDYRSAIGHLISDQSRNYDYFHTVVPDWDNTARAGKKALILNGSTPQLWQQHLQEAVDLTEKNNGPNKQYIFVKSWNEWAEGNYLEPDMKWGHRYLEVVQKVVKKDYVLQNQEDPTA